MTDTVYASSVRRNLRTLLVYAETVNGYPRRHAAELREALNEALLLASTLRMSGAQVFMITLTSILLPVFALRRVERFLEKAGA